MMNGSRRRLGIYLNDHLALAVAGVELARRITRENEGTEFGAPLAQLAGEIEADRESLRALIAELGIREVRPKQGAAGVMEKVSRLKLNGQLRGYSPLSRLIEVEALEVGIVGKLAMWKALQTALPGGESRAADLAALAERAQRQLEVIEGIRLQAASQALG